MVDRKSRDSAFAILEGWRNRTAANDAFEDFPKSRDRALKAVSDIMWFTYDDVYGHHLAAPLDERWEGIFDRCLLFLKSDLEYEWKALFHYDGHFAALTWLSEQMKKRSRGGDYEAWPFFRRQDYLIAKQRTSQILT